jgi:POT family proton-dependent oligopeptide transporter
MPAGVPYIVGNEAAERFSYYGMRAILVVFMTQHLADAAGRPAPMSDAEAKTWFHLFASAAYFFPVLGALVSDVLLGKYRTIVLLSLVYCAGHLVLALDDTRVGLAAGMGLIAIGSGGIKPCVSAHVGDQFGRANQHLLEKVFGWFYFAINLGAFASTLLTPLLLERHGPHVAFGLPGALMLVATWVFWLGRRKFVHVPPAGREFLRETFGAEGLRACGRLAVIYLFVAVFWALYDQTASAWVLQAEHMNRNLFGFEWLSSQVQAVNPILIMLYIPIFSYAVYPLLARVVEPTPLRRIWIGFIFTVIAFLVPAWVERQIAAGLRPSIAPRRLRDPDGRRSPRLDHVLGVLVHAGATAHEVVRNGAFLAFCHRRKPLHLRGELRIAGGKRRAAEWRRVLSFLRRGDAGCGDGISHRRRALS